MLLCHSEGVLSDLTDRQLIMMLQIRYEPSGLCTSLYCSLSVDSSTAVISDMFTLY